MLWWISEFLWLCSEFHYDNMNRQPICKEYEIGRISVQLIICIWWNIDLTTCAHIRIQHDFHRGAVAMIEEVFCNRNWHTRWNIKSSAGDARWPTGLLHLWDKSWWRPMVLTVTVRGGKKLLPFQISQSVSPYSGLASMIWEITG